MIMRGNVAGAPGTSKVVIVCAGAGMIIAIATKRHIAVLHILA
jgi:hypothetical protein